MRTLGGILGYVAVIAVLVVGGFLGLVGLLSPSLGGPAKVAAYGAPTRVRHAELPAAPTVETQTHRIGPAIVHQAPEPPSQSALAKARTRTAEHEARHRMADSFQARTRVAPRRENPRENPRLAASQHAVEDGAVAATADDNVRMHGIH